jgi:hypothetical protein
MKAERDMVLDPTPDTGWEVRAIDHDDERTQNVAIVLVNPRDNSVGGWRWCCGGLLPRRGSAWTDHNQQRDGNVDVRS